MELDELMAAFAKETGLGDLHPDDDGVYSLVADDLHVNFASVGDGLHFILWAEVCAEPESEDGRLWRILMQAMFEDRAVNGDAFSIGEGSVFLHHREATAGTDLERFKTVLGGFLNRVETWRDQIARFDSIESELNAAADALRQEQRQIEADGFVRV